jgi:hypothetical protein
VARRGRFVRGVAASLAAAAVGTALAGVDLTVRNGDKISSEIDAGGEVETFRFTCPAGALVSVKAKSAKKGPPLRVRALTPILVSLGENTGTTASVVGETAPVTGVYTAEVSAADGDAGTPYSVSIAWKSPKKFGAPATLDPGGEGQLAFSGEAGATATLSVKKAKRSAAVPVVLSLSGPDGDTALVAAATATVVLPVTGDYTLTFGDSGTSGGAVTAAVKVKTAKPAKLTIDLGTSGVPAGTSLDTSRLIGPAGGTLGADGDGPIAGASVTVPSGALSQPTSLLIGSTSVIATTAPGISAGPAIFLGPEGLSFAPAQVQVTIPFDASFFEGGTSGLRVYTRAADGTIEEITGVTIDAVASTVTFAVSHFSTFEVRRAFPIIERPQLTNPAGIGTVHLGNSAAVDGDGAALGIPFHDPTGINSGAGGVVVHHRNGDGTWTLDGVLTTPGFGTGDSLGKSVAISGDTLVAGAPLRTPVSDRTGTAEVWRRDVGGVWQFEAELVPPGALFGWESGNAVAIDGDTAVVAAHGDAADVGLGGAVHVFVRSGSTWSFQQRLTEASPTASGRFGGSVAIDGDTIVVGSFESTGRAGSVDVFHRSGTTWSRDGRIVALAGFANDTFGTSVSVSGGRIAVGAPNRGADGEGSAYVYLDEITSFPLDAVIPSADPTQPADATARFGASVVLRGAVLVVGAPLQDVLAPPPQLKPSGGQVLVYESSSAGKWLLSARLRGAPTDVNPLAPGDKFGSAVSFDGESIVSGAPDSAFGVGGAYAFDVR